MRGTHPYPHDAAQVRENLRVHQQFTDELYYSFQAGPGLGVVLAPAAFVFRAAGRFGYVLLPNGATTGWIFPVKVREDWRRVKVRWTTWYTSDAAGGGNFTVSFFGAPFGASGDNAATLGDTFSSAASLAAPAVAEDLKTHVYLETVNLVNTLRPWLSCRIVRTDPDPNPNELHIYATLLEFEP